MPDKPNPYSAYTAYIDRSGEPNPYAVYWRDGKYKPTGDTITKQAADYTPKASMPEYSCGKCKMFRAPSACSLVQGAISPRGSCWHWRAKR